MSESPQTPMFKAKLIFSESSGSPVQSPYDAQTRPVGEVGVRHGRTRPIEGEVPSLTDMSNMIQEQPLSGSYYTTMMAVQLTLNSPQTALIGPNIAQ